MDLIRLVPFETFDQLLSYVESFSKKERVVQVGNTVTDLIVALTQRRSPKSTFSLAQIDQEKDTIFIVLEF